MVKLLGLEKCCCVCDLRKGVAGWGLVWVTVTLLMALLVGFRTMAASDYYKANCQEMTYSSGGRFRYNNYGYRNRNGDRRTLYGSNERTGLIESDTWRVRGSDWHFFVPHGVSCSSVKTTIIITIIRLVFWSLSVPTGILMITGAMLKKRWLLIPWVIVAYLTIGLSFWNVITQIRQLSYGEPVQTIGNVDPAVMISMRIIFVILGLYYTLCVISLFRKMGEYRRVPVQYPQRSETRSTSFTSV